EAARYERSGETIGTTAAHDFDRAINLVPDDNSAMKAGLYLEAGQSLFLRAEWFRGARDYFEHARDLYDALGPSHIADSAATRLWLGKLELAETRYAA